MNDVQKYGAKVLGEAVGKSGPAEPPAFPRLRPGPGQKADRVASHQRARLQRAMLHLVANEGYDSITVRKLAGLAGVSTASFYARFDGKEECFLESCAVVLDRIRSRVQASRSYEFDQRTQLTRAAEAFLGEPTADPDAVRVALIDSYGGGPAALKLIRGFEVKLEADVKASLGRRVTAPSATVTAWITAGWVRACRNLVGRDGREGDQLASRLTSWGNDHLDDARVQSRATGKRAPVEAETARCPEGFDERAAILAAAIKLALSDGYWQLNPSTIRKQAGVSRANFGMHFEGAEDSYLAAVASLLRDYLSPVFSPRNPARASARSVHHAVLTLNRRLAAEPEKASLAFVGILDPGSPGIQLREQLIGEFSTAWQGVPTAGVEHDPLAAEATVSAFWRAIVGRIEASLAGRLPLEAPTLTLLLLAPSRRRPLLDRPVELMAMSGAHG